MSKSAFLKYDPSSHAEEYGWLWTEGNDGETSWHLISTFEDEDDLRVYFVAADQTEDAEAFAGQPFMLVSEPPASGVDKPGFILTLDDHRGLRVSFSWGAQGCENSEFAKTIRAAIDHAISGGQAQ
jgi:hypothetical protein